MRLAGNDACGDNAFGLGSHVEDILNLGGGKGEAVDKLVKVKSVKIDEIPDPIH